MVPQLLFTINVLRPTKVGAIQLTADTQPRWKQGTATDSSLRVLGWLLYRPDFRSAAPGELIK